MKVFQNILCIALLGCRSFGQEASPKLHVRNAKAAIEIGKAELIRRYGRQVINSEQPISAKLEDRTWTVNTPQWCQEMLPAQGFYCHGGHWVRISGDDGRVVAAGAYPDLAQ
ncbi:MAG: NTF2 fold immunity protein [Terriglobales bacterium]|jgi:hypothetical protein